MAKDPICGMTVDETTALHAERDGQAFYFCSEHCRGKFLSQKASAEKDADHSGGGQKSGHHDHAALEQETPGEAVKTSSAAKEFWPMCDGVESDKAGS